MYRFLLILMFAATPAALSADDNTPPSSLDEQLLDGLADDLLDGLDDLPPIKTPPEAPENSQAPPELAPGEEPIDNQLDLENLGGEDIGGRPENVDPLQELGRQMRKIEDLIRQQNTSEKTQRMQQQVLETLAMLVEQKEQQKQQMQQTQSDSPPPPGQNDPLAEQQQKPAEKKGSPQAGNQAARNSSENVGEQKPIDVETNETEAMFKKVWGHLPDRVREQMQSGAVEQFLPKYEKLIEDYYRRLARERMQR